MRKELEDEVLPLVKFKKPGKKLYGESGDGGRNKTDQLYRPKYSFERLILDSVRGGSLVFGDEEFWNGIRQEAEHFRDTPVVGSSHDDVEAHGGGSGGDDVDIMHDGGVIYADTSRGSKVSSIDGTLALALFVHSVLGADIDEKEIESIMLDGILDDIEMNADIMAKTINILPLVLDSVFRGDNPKLAEPLLRMVRRIISQFADHAVLKAWKFTEFLAQSTRNETINYLIRFQAEIITLWADSLEREFINESFLQWIRLSMDLSLYKCCQEALGGLVKAIVDWLDVSRIHLLVDWIEEVRSILFHHPLRVVNVVRLLGTSILDHVSAKMIIDRALFEDLKGRDRGGGGERQEEGREGNDLEFIIAYTSILKLMQSSDLDSLMIPKLYRLILLGHARLLRTSMEPAYSSHYEELVQTISNVKNTLIPPNCVSVHIKMRDILSKMETYMRSFLARSQRGILRQRLLQAAETCHQGREFIVQ